MMRSFYKKVSKCATANDLYCNCVNLKNRKRWKQFSEKRIRKAIDTQASV